MERITYVGRDSLGGSDNGGGRGGRGGEYSEQDELVEPESESELDSELEEESPEEVSELELADDEDDESVVLRLFSPRSAGYT
jgi:hypothetical protein